MNQKNEGIYDARGQLGWPKTIVLGFQHMFAMFGATVLVPALTGLSVSATLLFAGPSFDQAQGPRIPGFFLRLYRRLCGNSAHA